MARKSQFNLIEALLSAMLLAFALPQLAMGQPILAQLQRPSSRQSQHKPVPLAHLYGHFLVYQNQLDTKAAELEAQGKDGSWLHNHLQQSLGLSDVEFAQIRQSSVRLADKVKALDTQATAIRAAGVSPVGRERLKDLTTQREAAINAEITHLKQTLPPDKIVLFEAFITQFFSPKPIIIQRSSTTGKPIPAAVQQ
jgi:hypothetical protein